MRRIGGSVSTHAMVEPSVGGVNAASGLAAVSELRRKEALDSRFVAGDWQG